MSLPSVSIPAMKNAIPVIHGVNRRGFLRRAAFAAAVPMIVPGSVLGLNGATAPSNRFTFGAFGVGNRARAILPNFLSFGEIQFVAASDCRADRLASAKTLIDNRYGNQDCAAYADFREMLARKDIDAVLIATGNRWHGMGSIYASRAGKDIYCEKPVSLTLGEGRKLADTCKLMGTVYQGGTQRRSTASYQFTRDAVRQGKIGKLKVVEMQVWSGPAIPLEAPAPVPKGWNYDMWLGQAPWHPYVPSRAKSWQYFWDTAEGVLTDMGCHYTDHMQWTLGTDDTGPVEFEATAEFPDPAKFASDTPITAEATCRYANGVVGKMYQRGAFKERYIRYIGDEGWIQVDDDTDVVTAEPRSVLGARASGGSGWGDASDHVRDLVRNMRTRGRTLVSAETAHRAISICQAWTISMRLGRKLAWDPVREEFDLPEANRMIYREPRAPWRA
jgi:predicted dehydrogenase